jgi:nitrogenase iron protein NifH
MIAFIPRDNLIQEAEINKKTVIEFSPDSSLSNIYKKLSEDIENNNDFVIPTPMGEQELESFYFSNMEV